MLATVNPEAAEAIDHPPAAPDIGTWVVFKGRDGFSRMHRTEFAALVLGSNPDGSLDLMVVMEPEDMMMETRVPFQSHNQPHFCWRWVKGDDASGLYEDLMKRVELIETYLEGEDKLGEDVNKLSTRLDAVEGVLMGPEVDDLTKRIEALEAKATKKG